MTDTKPQTLISGKTIISTMQTISSLGQIGKKILISAGIDEIEAEKWYPHELRILLLNQIYIRFGTDAIYFIGLKNVLLFPEGVKVIRAIGKTYEDSLASNSSDSNIVLALKDYFRKLVNIFDNSIKVNTRGQHDLFGMGLTKISATHFNIKVSATTDVNHEAFYRGNLVTGLPLFLLSEWKFDIEFKSEIREPQLCMTTYEYEYVFYRHKSEKSSAELLNDLQINAGEALLKKVVLDSDNSLMKLDAAHKVVVESVNYASRLQRGQLPRQMRIDGRFASFASIWEPRDTIGGDLYWGYQDVVAEADKPVVQTIPYQSGDVFAVVTDGFTDQIGGAIGKTSFGYRRLEEILKVNFKTSAEEITAAMKHDFAAWQGTNARRDDVTAVVFRLR